MEYIDELRKTMAEHKLIFMYEGEFTQDIILSLLRVAEKKMNALGENLKVTRKVFNVMTECLQNIVKYSDQVPNENAQVVGAPEDETKTAESNDSTSVSPDAQPANAAGTTTTDEEEQDETPDRLD